ncbi:hypothetical protein ACLB2K_052166 [Fragaria x ananassa]
MVEPENFLPAAVFESLIGMKPDAGLVMEPFGKRACNTCAPIKVITYDLAFGEIFLSYKRTTLVVTTGSRSRDTHEPIGELESLRGRVDPKSFGDRVCRGRPEGEIGKKRDRDGGGGSIRRKWCRVEEQKSVLSETEEGVYRRPKTRETPAAYEALLVLKNDKLRNSEKKSEIEKLLDAVSDSVFDGFVRIRARITDYEDRNDGGVANGDERLDDLGVSVEFEENEDNEEGNDFDLVQDDDEEEEEEEDGDLGERAGSGAMQFGRGIDDVEM